MDKFQVAGISTHNGRTKVRFANDFVTRIKMLIKGGHTNVNLMTLPTAMTKPEAVAYLKTTDLYQQFPEVIDTAMEKYNPAVKVSGISISAIKAREGIES
jgi:phospholipase/lecithinase/hemolysin